jgi:hypothetical protein
MVCTALFSKKKEAAISGGSDRTSKPWSVLLKLGRNAGELAVERGADRIDRGDDHDRNARSNQTVFNGRSAGFILEERKDARHVTNSLSLLRAGP